MSDISLARPTWAKVQLDNLKFNFKSAKDFIGTDLLYMAVVKADAYGHGAVPCAKTLVKSGADWLGVACPRKDWNCGMAELASQFSASVVFGQGKRILCWLPI